MTKTKNCSKSELVDSLTIKKLFCTWLRIGFTSFGGGAITQYLIQEHFIYKNKWITPEEYATIIAMCQISPGINILGYTILIGKRLAGWKGIFVSLMGLILPSAAITVGISAMYSGISGYPKVEAALRAVFAAIFGVSLATNWRNIRPIFIDSYKRGAFAFLAILGILCGTGIIYLVFKPPLISLYLLGGLCGALTYWYIAKRERGDL